MRDRAKRHIYSLRNCNPPERKKRKEVNELDFQKVFPFYSFDKDRVDLNMVRRFLYQNKISCCDLYTEEMIKRYQKERERNPINISGKNITNRFDILDL